MLLSLEGIRAPLASSDFMRNRTRLTPIVKDQPIRPIENSIQSRRCIDGSNGEQIRSVERLILETDRKVGKNRIGIKQTRIVHALLPSFRYAPTPKTEGTIRRTVTVSPALAALVSARPTVRTPAPDAARRPLAEIPTSVLIVIAAEASTSAIPIMSTDTPLPRRMSAAVTS